MHCRGCFFLFDERKWLDFCTRVAVVACQGEVLVDLAPLEVRARSSRHAVADLFIRSPTLESWEPPALLSRPVDLPHPGACGVPCVWVGWVAPSFRRLWTPEFVHSCAAVHCSS